MFSAAWEILLTTDYFPQKNRELMTMIHFIIQLKRKRKRNEIAKFYDSNNWAYLSDLINIGELSVSVCD